MHKPNYPNYNISTEVSEGPDITANPDINEKSAAAPSWFSHIYENNYTSDYKIIICSLQPTNHEPSSEFAYVNSFTFLYISIKDLIKQLLLNSRG